MTTTLTDAEVVQWAERLHKYRHGETRRLDRIYQYLHDPNIENLTRYTAWGEGPLRWLRQDAPMEVKRLAEMSRVNMLGFVINATTQVMYVDGYRSPKAADEAPAWTVWQANRMDARQIGIHRSALAYGASYATVLPGDPVPVIRGVGAREMTAVYGDDDEWPELALEKRHGKNSYRMYDSDRTFNLNRDDQGRWSVEKNEIHSVGVCPVVRFRPTMDIDGEIVGEVEPLIPIQDQINVTTFGLLVAQHYGAFRQRYIMGWIPETEAAALKTSASKLWVFEDGPDRMAVGEFSQTDLSGYIASREASLRHLATISQTPAHELLGQLVNLSADALAAAERNHRAKVLERQTSFGESWEQVLDLAAQIGGIGTDSEGDGPAVDAEVRWRDTEARSLSQVADALGKLVAGLGVPPQELWEKIPGVTQQDVERWKISAAQGDAISQLNTILTAQSQPGSVTKAEKSNAAPLDPNVKPPDTMPSATKP